MLPVLMSIQIVVILVGNFSKSKEHKDIKEITYILVELITTFADIIDFAAYSNNEQIVNPFKGVNVIYGNF